MDTQKQTRKRKADDISQLEEGEVPIASDHKSRRQIPDYSGLVVLQCDDPLCAASYTMCLTNRPADTFTETWKESRKTGENWYCEVDSERTCCARPKRVCLGDSQPQAQSHTPHVCVDAAPTTPVRSNFPAATAYPQSPVVPQQPIAQTCTDISIPCNPDGPCAPPLLSPITEITDVTSTGTSGPNNCYPLDTKHVDRHSAPEDTKHSDRSSTPQTVSSTDCDCHAWRTRMEKSQQSIQRDLTSNWNRTIEAIGRVRRTMGDTRGEVRQVERTATEAIGRLRGLVGDTRVDARWARRELRNHSDKLEIMGNTTERTARSTMLCHTLINKVRDVANSACATAVKTNAQAIQLRGDIQRATAGYKADLHGIQTDCNKLVAQVDVVADLDAKLYHAAPNVQARLDSAHNRIDHLHAYTVKLATDLQRANQTIAALTGAIVTDRMAAQSQMGVYPVNGSVATSTSNSSSDGTNAYPYTLS